MNGKKTTALGWMAGAIAASLLALASPLPALAQTDDTPLHEVTASVLPEGASDPHKDTVMVAIESGETRTLKLTAGRPLGSTVSLRVH